MEQLKSRIEAVLFVTAKVLQIKDIAEILEEEPEKVEEALLDKKVAQEVIEAVEKEEENIIKEASIDGEVMLDMDKEESNNNVEVKDK